MATISTKFSFDTKLSADSVEWCPNAGHENLLAVGTYQVEKDQASEEFSDDQRFGRIYMFAESGEENYELVCQRDTRAILDMKWSSSSTLPILAVTTSSGQLVLYNKDLSPLASVEIESLEKKPVVLSLDWNDRLISRESGLKVVTSDSSGSIHLWSFRDGGLEVVDAKKVHDFEAWITAFDAWNDSIAYSGGDDCKLMQSDFRDCQPIKIIGKCEHEAGVTSLLSDIHEEHRLFSGSYDEYLRLWDLRHAKQPLDKYHAKGGVWRIKQPRKSNDFLGLACMHNGFQILRKQGMKSFAAYSEHDSLAYGLDFHEGCGGLKLASCSFYDCLLKIWTVTSDSGDT